MAELSELFSSLLDGAVSAIAKSEAKHVKTNVEAAMQLAGKDLQGGVPLQVMKDLLDGGFTADMFAGAEIEIDAALSMSTSRERKVVGSGNVVFGPVRIEASLQTGLTQATQTNLSVRCLLRRVSKSAAMDNMVESVQRLSELPAGVAPPPTPK